MIEVAGIWSLGWDAPLTEMHHWEMPLRGFGIQRLNMCPVSGISHRMLHEYATMRELLDDRPLLPVFIDEKGTIELSEFKHPINSLYVFGRVGLSPMQEFGDRGPSVRIDCDLMGMLWPHQALSVVMYDRRRKDK